MEIKTLTPQRKLTPRSRSSDVDSTNIWCGVMHSMHSMHSMHAPSHFPFGQSLVNSSEENEVEAIHVCWVIDVQHVIVLKLVEKVVIGDKRTGKNVTP